MTTKNYKSIVWETLPSPKITMNSTKLEERLIILLKKYKLEPMYGDKFYYFKPNFSKSLTCIMSYEPPLSIKVLETSKLTLVSIITKGKISLGMMPTFSFLMNHNMGFPSFFLMGISLSLSTVISSTNFIFMVPFDGASIVKTL